MPTHRQSQFSLKTLLLATTAIAVGCGALAFGARELTPSDELPHEILEGAIIGMGVGLIGLGFNMVAKRWWWASLAIITALTWVACRAID